jgi:adenylate cyclase
MSERTQRRLAAIVSLDVVGYSRLMGADEAGTLSAMRAHRAELWNPAIERFGGRVVGTAGDSLLIEFASAVAAVEASTAVQRGMVERNADLPDERRMLVRIGINIGEVIVDGDDIFGDCVNVAARLQGIAESNGIAISGNIHEQVNGKVDVAFSDDGEHAVKNIDRPVRVWRWSAAQPAAAANSTRPDAPAPIPDKPAIAVLPFDNMSGDPEQEYFSDGIAEDVITDLSKISALFVIARNSSFAYKGQSVDIRRCAEELGVTHVLEGSVRRAANRVRINAQLIEGSSGRHLWAERYDRDLDDIFAIQDEITRKVVDALKVTLKLDEQTRIGKPMTADIEAYDITLRANNLLYRHTRKDVAEAVQLFEKAIAKDPTYGAPQFGLAVAHFNIYTSGWTDEPDKILARGHQLATKAVEIEPTEPQGHWALALAELWQRNHDQAISEAEQAIALDPNYAQAYAIHGYALSYASRPAEAIESLEMAMRLDPQHNDIWLHFLAHAYFVQADYQQAATLLERRILRQPATDISRVLLASCYGHLGREAEARASWAKTLEINPNYSIEQKARVLPYKNPADWQRFVDGLGKAGLP